MKKILFIVPFLAFVSVASFAEETTPIEARKPFFDAYCTQCHGESKQKGDVRLDDREAIGDDAWQLVYDQLVSGDMPPEDEPQPTEEERDGVIDYILSMGSAGSTTSAPGLRRLNKREYAYTVEDLLGLTQNVFDPAAYIYDDEIDHGFDTEAESLIISNELLLEYLRAAERSLRVALFSAEVEKPKAQVIVVPTARIKGGSRRYVTFNKEHAILRVGGGNKIYDGSETRIMSAPGLYRIKVKASAIDRDFYGVPMVPQTGPLKLGIGLVKEGDQGLSEGGELQAVFDLKDNQEQTITYDIWINQGFYPYLTFANGPGKPITQIRAGVRRNTFEKKDMNQQYRGPGIKITEYKIEGPFNKSWPPETYKITYGANEIPDLSDSGIRQQLIRRFMSRAFRRPVANEEISPYWQYLETQYSQTQDWHESMIRTYAATMGSIDFLFIRIGEGELDSFALANRLSYFFWSSMPDPELFRLAQTDELKDPVVLKQQVLRLLAHPRAERFSRSFVDQWLSLDKLGSMPPDAKSKEFRIYYRNGLESAMLEETRRFFSHVLFQNKSIRDFIDSDYSFLNKSLADHYQIPFSEEEFALAKLPPESKRGGLLGHASIHALTSNGVETSPVERGHWVLDEFLGTPPPPAPKEVPALVPDLAGVTTVRQQLEKHRSDSACMECHRKMDPPGFAMEAFDPIGRFRTKYDNSRVVETNSVFLGQKFQDIDGLKDILMTQSETFARSLIIKISEYAKGRKLEIGDLPTVERILKSTELNDYPLKQIVAEIAISDLMTRR